MDIVIPFRTSEYNNIELRYCLASIKKFLTGYNKIYIIGDDPGFVASYIHIDAEDRDYNNQDNIRRKIEIACREERISQDFFFTNDDHAFLKTLDVRTLPYYYSGDLVSTEKKKRKKGSYLSALQNTKESLDRIGAPIKYFDIHTPIIYNKASFPLAMGVHDWQKSKWGFTIKTLYCNTLKIEGQEMPDMMIGYSPTDPGQVLADIKDRPFFAYNEVALSDPYGTSAPNKAMIDVLDAIIA